MVNVNLLFAHLFTMYLFRFDYSKATDLAYAELLESNPIHLDFKLLFPFACLFAVVYL